MQAELQDESDMGKDENDSTFGTTLSLSAPSIDVGVRLQWQKFLSKALKAMQLPQMMPSHQTHPASTERAS